MLIFCILIYCSAAVFVNLELQPHGFTSHKSFTLGSVFGNQADVRMEYTEASDGDLIWMWTRFSCPGTLDVYQLLPDGSLRLHLENVRVRLQDLENEYRVVDLRQPDCPVTNGPCIFIFRITVTRACTVNVYCERGVLLQFAETSIFSRDDYRWGNYSSTLQLYGVQPTSSDFPLSIKITLPSTSYLNLQHAWGLEATVYKSTHRGTFTVAIPQKRTFQEGWLVYIWVGVLDRSTYSISIDRAAGGFYQNLQSNGLNLLILACLAFVIFVGTCVRWAFQDRSARMNPRGPGVIEPRLSVTAAELTTFEKFEWEGDNEGETSQCSICLEDFEKHDQLRRLPCRHYFHIACIDNWLMNHRRVCPLCQQDVGEAKDFHSPPTSPRCQEVCPGELIIDELENDALDLSAIEPEDGTAI